ncbi:MAG: holo-ACP synthase [Dehalococcoidia bacterium]
MSQVISVGVDIAEIDRVEAAIERGGKRPLDGIYTEVELKTCRDRPGCLASPFAAKKAVMKVLATGGTGIAWREIDILTGSDGKPSVKLHGQALSKAAQLHLTEVCVSLSESKEYAVAVAIGV